MLRRALVLVLFLLSLAHSQEEAQKLDVSYAVDASTPEGGTVHVTMHVRHFDGKFLDVAIPCWRPGSYRLQTDFKNVKGVTAKGSGELTVRAVDEMTWRVQSGGVRDVTVEYTVNVERTRLDKDHFFFEGPSLYMYVVNHKDAPCHVEFKIPEGWKVGTGLDSKEGVYFARDYDTFIDCPTELGTFQLLEFDQDGAKYQIVLHADGEIDGKRLVESLRKIVKEQNAVFGGPPFDRYVFLYHLRGQSPGYGGLEHLNSTNISGGYSIAKTNVLYLASVSSHEYFHLWNVKRIRPHELGPFDYTGAVRSRHLWLCEGVTSYYGDRAMERTGIWDEKRYFAHLASEIEMLQNQPDRKVTSVERAGENVWENQFRGVNYYNKGELLGLLLDLRIRTVTDGAKTLDDVMRYLFDTYVVQPSKSGQGAIGVGFERSGILKAINVVSGNDFTGFYRKYVSGVEELPFEEALGAAGLDVKIEISRSPVLPLLLRGTTIQTVRDEASNSGLKAGDRIVALNGKEVARENITGEVRKLEVGSEVKVTVMRGDEKVEAKLKVGEREANARCSLARKADPTDSQKKILDAWLSK